jgi:DNA repair protein RecO (recombination protein O)
MASFKDQAIVLRRLDYSESSQVLAFLTREHGQRRLIAKGIKRGTKKKFAAGIDLLEQGSVVFWHRPQSESGLGTLTEWRQTEIFAGLRASLDRWYAAHYMAEITSAMTQENDPHPPLYDALSMHLSAVAGGEPILPRLTVYQRAVLETAGLWPDLTRCVICNRPAPAGRAAYFSAQQGGLVCRECTAPLVEKRLVSGPVLTDLREGGAAQAIEAFRMLDYVIAHAIGRRVALAGRVLGMVQKR